MLRLSRYLEDSQRLLLRYGVLDENPQQNPQVCMCMYACMYVLYVCMMLCLYACMSCMHACMYVFMYVHIYTYTGTIQGAGEGAPWGAAASGISTGRETEHPNNDWRCAWVQNKKRLGPALPAHLSRTTSRSRDVAEKTARRRRNLETSQGSGQARAAVGASHCESTALRVPRHRFRLCAGPPGH